MAGRNDTRLAGAVQETNFEPERPPPNDAESRPVNGHRNGGSYGSFPAPEGIDGAAAAPAKPPSAPSARALGPDLLRGLLMALMAFDHVSVVLHTFPHGTGGGAEGEGQIVRKWNDWVPYTIRTLTHLCAPGFTFLLGLGIVYFGASRQKLGWTPWRMAKHFFWRGFALFGVSTVMGLIFSVGQIWVFNMVLIMLAWAYFLTGLLYLAIVPSERGLAWVLLKVLPRKESEAEDVTEPLLRSPVDVHRAPDKTIQRAADISWHVHNALLLVLALVTIWWNIWLAPNGGRCVEEVSTPSIMVFPKGEGEVSLFAFMFYPVVGTRVMSGFPPMAWVSFAILGLLYGRILLARPWPAKFVAMGNALAGLAFLVLFVFTRVLEFGNLTQDCLRTPEHDGAAPGDNQYLTSAASFMYIAKYPPDVAFFAFTMGGNLLLLAAFTILPTDIGKRFKLLTAYGTSALFFYFCHMWLLLLIGGPIVALFGQEMPWKDEMEPDKPLMGVPSYWAYFGVWVTIVAIMYPLCRWYSGFKSKKSADSIWRFF